MINSVTNWLSCGSGVVENWFFGEGEDEDDTSSSNESDIDSIDDDDSVTSEEEEENLDGKDIELKDKKKLTKKSKKSSSKGRTEEYNEQGLLYSWGYNYHGQCGNSKNQSIRLPTLINFPNNVMIRIVSCGESHTIAISDNYKQVFSWGCNRWGQLGHGDKISRNEPTLISTLQQNNSNNSNNSLYQWRDVKCGSQHSFLVSQFGEVFSFGCGTHGRLGHGDEIPRYIPVPIPSLLGKQIISISGGLMHSVCVDNQGKVYSWGWNRYGQLGNGTIKQQTLPGKVKELAQHNIVKVSCGRNHTIVLTNKGEMYSFGFNACGQLGNGNHTNSRIPVKIELHDRVIDISCGYYHSLCLTDNGEAYSWGYMSDGALGLGEVYGHQHKPQLIPLAYTRHTYSESNDFYDELYPQTEGNQNTNFEDTENQSVEELLKNLNLSNANHEGPNSSVVNRHDHINSSTFKNNTIEDKYSVGDTVDKISANGWHSSIITSSGKVYQFGFGDNFRLGNDSEEDQDFPILVNGSQWGVEKSISLTNPNDLNNYEYNFIIQDFKRYQKKLSNKMKSPKIIENNGTVINQNQNNNNNNNTENNNNSNNSNNTDSPSLNNSEDIKVYSRVVFASLGSAHSMVIIKNKVIRKK